ncbi:mannose-6-phosphate isomerase, class I [Ruicaihuangia caeni]|uniref:mannose-6-phosphate isomerase n=1 Tax=Ruicaihuangia caeni TaxID=3042517 RepID=A0AAW6T8V1_9MICO|nr:mannose-6-phosphate isomerase, class I [Klugiella sp. YN-L-19]MDI2099206.1 mannose-6-phosphate isomerase, class I [Klugiella sp. YN-L-19]
MHILTGVARRYAWGSTSQIQAVLGTPNDADPLAELWFGAHPTAPSPTRGRDGAVSSLDALLEAEPALLGADVAERFGELPFLMKFLAPAQPVSLQVHPTPENARAGFEREEALGIPIDAFNRSFKDVHHKPEMVFAVTDFEGLVGFRDRTQLERVLGDYRHPAIRDAQRLLEADRSPDGLRSCLRALVSLKPEQVDQIVDEARELAEGERAAKAGRLAPHSTVVELASYYPADAGAVASLMLNRIAFAPGECVYVSSGTPHAYLDGLAVELMANSDNVFRAGLTSKYVDVEGLLENVDVASGPISLLSAEEAASGVRVLRPGAEEFELTAVELDGSVVELAGSGPRIAVGVRGSITLHTDADNAPLELLPGGAVFVSDAERMLTASGRGHFVIGSVPIR